MLFDVELHCDKWKNCKTKWCNNDDGFWCKEDCKLLQVRPITRKRKGNDEWLPHYCEFADNVCPNTVGVACWEQYLLHKDKREERDD